jgi:hypothetical protein
VIPFRLSSFLIVAVIVLLASASICFAQNKPQPTPQTASLANDKARMKTTLHVTSVHSEEAKDGCESGTCTAKRIRVEGYTGPEGATGSIEYLIECVETTVVNPHHITLACPRVHPHRDYVVYVFDDGMNFDLGGQQPSTGVVGIYDVVSENEVASHKVGCPDDARH